MKTIVVYLRLYGDCLRQALLGARRSIWTLLLPGLLFFVWLKLAELLAGRGLGILGGLLVFAIEAAIVSCYLYFVSEIVSGFSVRLQELQHSIGAYFWSVVNVLFVLWIVKLVLGFVVRGPNVEVIFEIVVLAELILLNAVPEVIYEKGTYGGLATIQVSIEFIQHNWIEWYLPNAVILGALYVVLARLDLGFEGYPNLVVAGVILHLGMIFRGHLFEALDGSSHRQRMFKYRNAA